MFTNTVKALTGLVNGSLGLVNTAINSTTCGINLLNTGVNTLSNSLGSNESIAKQMLSEPSLAYQFVHGDKPKGIFNKKVKQDLYNPYLMVKDNVIVFTNEADEEYYTNIDGNLLPRVLDMMRYAVNVFNYLDALNSGVADRFTLTDGQQSIILWDDLSEGDPEEIKNMAGYMLEVLRSVK